jgi:hypothetical protein
VSLEWTCFPSSSCGTSPNSPQVSLPVRWRTLAPGSNPRWGHHFLQIPVMSSLFIFQVSNLYSPKNPTADISVHPVTCESLTSDVTSSALESLVCDRTGSLPTLGLGCRLLRDSLPLFPCRATRVADPNGRLFPCSPEPGRERLVLFLAGRPSGNDME